MEKIIGIITEKFSRTSSNNILLKHLNYWIAVIEFL